MSVLERENKKHPGIQLLIPVTRRKETNPKSVKVLINFLLNFLLLSLATLANLWSENWIYWYVPDIFFLAVIWVQFIDKRINYLALTLLCCINDVINSNEFGTLLVAYSIVLYLIGVLSFINTLSSKFFVFAVVFFGYLATIQISIFVNHGIEGILGQLVMLNLVKALITALAWLVASSLLRKL